MKHQRIDLPRRKNGTPMPWDGDVFVFPTTVGQQGFWYLDQIEPGNPSYNIAVRFRIQGPLDHALIAHVINEIIRRHEALRTVIVEVDAEPVQLVAPALAIPVPVIDLRSVAAADRHARSELLTVEEAQRHFDLSAGPLIRASLLRLEDNVHVLLVTVHHIISDGWSIGIISDELGALYAAFSQGLESPLPDLSLQFGDFAVWQQQWLESAQLEDQFSYWTNKLANLPVLEIPTDRPRALIKTSNGHIESLVLPRRLTDGLQVLSHKEEVTFFMLSLAVLKVLLARSTGQTDIFTGTLVAGRSRVELEPLIGNFINPLVLRTDLSGDPTFVELLGRVRETVVEALARQEIPFERIVKAVQPRRDASRHPVFQINFIYQRDFVKPVEAAGLTLTALPSRSPGAIYDLNFFMVERADGWRASCEYNTDLYEASTINRLLGQWQAIFESVLSDPGQRISQIRIDREAHLPGTAAANGHAAAADRRSAAESVSSSPSDQVGAKLSEIWQRVLGVNTIGRSVNFFDAGGHSLLIARVLAATERAFGRRMSMAAFLQTPTIDGMRAFIEGERTETPRDQVIAYQTDGPRPPFIILDTGTIFRHLISLMQKDQPVYGLVMPELSQLPTRFTVKDITTNLIAALQEVCPDGPYVLGGWSHAGVVAYAMAQQLRAAGEEVVAVVLFDTNSPEYLRRFKRFRALPLRAYIVVEKLLYHFANLRRLTPDEALRYARDRLETIRDGWKRQIWRIWYRALGRPQAPHLNESTQFQFLAVEDYEPEPSDIPLILFRSQVFQTGPFRDPRLGWGELAPESLIVHELPGNHAAMFIEPVVSQLAEELNDELIRSSTTEPAHYFLNLSDPNMLTSSR